MSLLKFGKVRNARDVPYSLHVGRQSSCVEALAHRVRGGGGGSVDTFLQDFIHYCQSETAITYG